MNPGADPANSAPLRAERDIAEVIGARWQPQGDSQ
jgi:hypothetical protein